MHSVELVCEHPRTGEQVRVLIKISSIKAVEQHPDGTVLLILTDKKWRGLKRVYCYWKVIGTFDEVKEKLEAARW